MGGCLLLHWCPQKTGRQLCSHAEMWLCFLTQRLGFNCLSEHIVFGWVLSAWCLCERDRKQLEIRQGTGVKCHYLLWFSMAPFNNSLLKTQIFMSGDNFTDSLECYFGNQSWFAPSAARLNSCPALISFHRNSHLVMAGGASNLFWTWRPQIEYTTFLHAFWSVKYNLVYF